MIPDTYHTTPPPRVIIVSMATAATCLFCVPLHGVAISGPSINDLGMVYLKRLVSREDLREQTGRVPRVIGRAQHPVIIGLELRRLRASCGLARART